MANQQSDETIRQMMAGFSSMQFNLGLLPMPQAQSMAGAPSPFQAPPPPPMVPHPSEAAIAAMQHQQSMIQQTLQAAQVTRYLPPPSAPMPAMSAMGAYGGFASPVPMGGGGGGGFMSGGRGGVSGFGNGGFAPAAMAMPSIFNPLAPTHGSGHFMSPGMHSLQMQQHAQTQYMGAMSGIGEGALGIGGSIIGGALGSALGPLGTMAGSWLGGKVGGAVASTIFNPVTQDFARGRQIQQMSAPFMVSGTNLNSATGQGFSGQSSRDIASGIRHLSRDHEFDRTGFNTQDAMRIMQSSAQQGLLTGVQSPDQIVQKVKEISKTVKLLMQVTGDPDVREAIQSLGQMRSLGFQGLAAQAGAVNNRAVFARMAGQSQAQMTSTMMAGADMAGQFGLVGATGANAAMYGAGAANVAASSGAVGEIGLSRVGGVQGLGQLNTRGSLAAMQNEQYLLAALGRDSKGRMSVDMDQYRATQKMSFEEVQRRAADSMRNMGTEGIFQWNTQKQELKDKVAQQLQPGEMQMMMLAQARQLQHQVPTMNLGSALQQTAGVSADEAGVLEHQFTSRSYWTGMMQQNRVQRQDAADLEREHRKEFQTPGMMTRMGRGIRGALGGLSDSISSPFRSASEYFDRVGEDRAATDRGESISRYGEADIAHDAGERSLLQASLRRGLDRTGSNFMDRAAGTSGLDRMDSGGRQLNRIGSYLGLASESDTSKLVSLADYSGGRYTSLGESIGDPVKALARVRDVASVGRAYGATQPTGAQLGGVLAKIGSVIGQDGTRVNAGAVLGATTQNVVNKLKGMEAGLIKSVRAFGESDFKEAHVSALMGGGMSRQQAESSWEENKAHVMSTVIESVRASGDKSLIEPLTRSAEVLSRSGAIDFASSTSAKEAGVHQKLYEANVGDLSDKTMQEVKSVVSHHDKDVVAMAASIRAREGGSESAQKMADSIDAEIYKRRGPEAYAKKLQEAQSVAKSFSGDAAAAFTRTFTPAGSTVDSVLGSIGKVTEAAGDTMAIAAEKEFKAKLNRVHAGASGAGSVEEAIGSLKDDEIEALDPATRAAVRKFQKGGDEGKAALQKAIEDSTPTGKQMRHSSATSSALDKFDETYAKMQDEADKADDDSGDKKDDGTGLATKMFADSVRLFAKAAGVISGAGDDSQLNDAHPDVQSQQSGS